MNIPTTVYRQRACSSPVNSRSLVGLIGTCLTAGLLAACGASSDGSSDGSAAATKSAELDSTIPGQRGGYASEDPIMTSGDLGESDESIEEKRARARRSGTATSAPAPTPAPATGPTASAPVPAASAPAPAASAPVPVASAPAPAPAGGTINSIDTIVNDMRLKNDLALAGIPTNYGFATGPGYVVMGQDPRGTNTPSWWQVNNSQYKSGAYWNAILPWMVVFDGVGNGASNTRVQLRNLKLYIKSKATGAWKLTSGSAGVGGELYPKSLQGSNTTSPNVRTEADGSTAVLPPGGNLVFHGWGSFSDINGSDVGGVFITLQARLIVDNPARGDDRSSARYLVHVGGDYYPDRSTRVSDMAPAYYIPGIGMSRAKLVSNDWQAYSFSTIDVGVEDPGGGVMTESQFRASPPPLE